MSWDLKHKKILEIQRLVVGTFQFGKKIGTNILKTRMYLVSSKKIKGQFSCKHSEQERKWWKMRARTGVYSTLQEFIKRAGM